ncbi:tyrosine-type recombinase/integrase [Actinacidiphila acidipaludis]|uniref:Site-specific integrase n=1 Tax=Actinacidiphila acidipaludis TaxID=2873382 RepID=A0ABS7Q7H4_9ACTN|nr:site-specific integrase [Streptomyces acidipaludis]MBY8879101.1 site-specific integrase [Streptomyces acidipaludis]
MATRRPNGGGTITRRKDGRYQGAAYVTNASGHRVRKYVYGRSYDEVAEKLGALQDKERAGVPVPDRTWKLAEWLDYWLEHIVKPNKEPGTYNKYEAMSRLYLVPSLGKKPLTRLTPAQVRGMLADLRREKPGQAATWAEALRTLRNALNRAMQEEVVGRNVAALVDMPQVTKRKVSPWSATEAIQFLRTARPHRLYAAFVLVLVLGLRRSEVLGLRWQDVDLENGQFTPTMQVQRVNGGLVLKKLKTDSSQAALPLPAFCLEALAGRRYLQELERRAAGEGWRQAADADLIFSERNGGPIEPRGFSRTFDALVTRSKVRRITVRLARHTCGTLLAYLKVHPKVAQAILRHSQISMTLDIYTHVVDEDQRAAAARLADLLNGLGPGR